jgi:hypothetical protein
VRIAPLCSAVRLFIGPLSGTGSDAGKGIAMISDWNVLSEPLQLALSREALRRAGSTLAEQAEVLAEEMECGTLADRGGPNALRLFAAVVRDSGLPLIGPVGHA